MNDLTPIELILEIYDDEPRFVEWLLPYTDIALAWQQCPESYWMHLLTAHHHPDADLSRYKWESQTASMLNIERSSGTKIRDELSHMEIALWAKWSYEFWDFEKEDWEEWDNRHDEMLNDVQHIYNYVFRVIQDDTVANEWYRNKLREIWGNPFVEDDSQ
jgi:hypothetical protein